MMAGCRLGCGSVSHAGRDLDSDPYAWPVLNAFFRPPMFSMCYERKTEARAPLRAPSGVELKVPQRSRSNWARDRVGRVIESGG